MKRFLLRLFVSLCWGAIFILVLFSSKMQQIFPSLEKEIDIFTWSDIFNPQVIENFEKQTNIKVKLHYYTSNEELLVKLKATKGKGYDLIVPSDYAVKILSDGHLLKEIDKSKLHFADKIHPLLQGYDFDPSMTYSIPFQWDIMGMGIDKEFFKERPLSPSWKQIFDEKAVFYKIAMVNDPIEAFNLAALYLFDNVADLDQTKITKIKQLLEKQKSWVEAYTDYRSSYLLATGNCPLAVSMSSYIWRLSLRFNFVSFIFPQDKMLVSIENFAIPRASVKEDLTYQFLNFIFQPENYAQNCNYLYLYPATTDVLPLLDLNEDFKKILADIFEKRPQFYFFRHLIPEKKIREIWVNVKAS